MQRVIALCLCVSFMLPACAARGSAAAQTQPQAVPRSPDADLWRHYVRNLPAGTILHIRTTSEEGVTGLLVAADDTTLVLDPRTRIPEPLRRLGFDRIAHIEVRDRSGTLAKAVAVGAGVGIGSFLGLLLLMTVIWGD